MTTSHIKYQGNLRTQIVHLKSGTIIQTDAPTDNEGKGALFSPTDLIASALGSCMLTVIAIRAKTHGFHVPEMEIEITKIMGSNPRKIAEIVLDFNFLGTKYTEKEKEIIERSARNCPVALSLAQDIKQNLRFNF